MSGAVNLVAPLLKTCAVQVAVPAALMSTPGAACWLLHSTYSIRLDRNLASNSLRWSPAPSDRISVYMRTSIFRPGCAGCEENVRLCNRILGLNVLHEILLPPYPGSSPTRTHARTHTDRLSVEVWVNSCHISISSTRRRYPQFPARRHQANRYTCRCAGALAVGTLNRWWSEFRAVVSPTPELVILIKSSD